jgi:hypothetical protein|nr:MAG: hypothetical protein KatS3mg041_1554 [Bacteroidota bacterium]
MSWSKQYLMGLYEELETLLETYARLRRLSADPAEWMEFRLSALPVLYELWQGPAVSPRLRQFAYMIWLEANLELEQQAL